MKTIFIDSDVKLEAKLTTPLNETSKIFIIVSGSGHGDMDGNVKQIKPNMYKLLSDELNNLGYATLRYNKRGIGESEGNFHTTGLSDFLTDLDACVKHAKDILKYKEVYLLGHSEGSIINTLYSKDHDIDGMILLSGAGVSLMTAVLEQNYSIIEEIKVEKGFKGKLLRLLVKEEKLIKKQMKLFNRFIETDKDMMRVQFLKMPAKWFREHFQYKDQDMLDILQDTKVPTLAITGSLDVQANPKDLDNVQALNNECITTNNTLMMDHLLRDFAGKKTILNLKKQYKGDTKKPLSNDLMNLIKEWLVINNI
jgi:pimeloyl-ACP methyl ester carboxylesterase